jgi:5-(carboxyamino)imidazole ribonucleotide mutase
VTNAFTGSPASQLAPLVGIIMGSDSDLPTMQGAIAACAEFGVRYEVAIVSAHRTPDRMVEYAQQAHARGLKVIIAGAGGAAHLPGMVAALTPLPVIGAVLDCANARRDSGGHGGNWQCPQRWAAGDSNPRLP